ncbi:MAG TPA: DUF6220 domain-containing protein [Actinoplanes sp.]|nr:DUF6220 domain-containing protein [Actinoplanes sp.]
MRVIYRVLALALALGVVVQAAAIAFAWFQVLDDTDAGGVFDKNTAENAGHTLHSVVGEMIMPTIAIVLLLLSFFAKIPGGVKWAAITLGVTWLQVLLAYGPPVAGAVHGVNAFALAGVASIAARKARLAGSAGTPEQPTGPADTAPAAGV